MDQTVNNPPIGPVEWQEYRGGIKSHWGCIRIHVLPLPYLWPQAVDAPLTSSYVK